MLPLAHAAFGYLVSALVGRLRAAEGPALLALGLGSQFPDVVDKPLANRGLLPSGRSFAHSLVVALPALFALRKTADEAGVERLGTAFAVGYLSHLLGDLLGPLARREWNALRPLGWPLIAAPEYEGDAVPPLVRVRESYRRPLPRTDLLLGAAALLCWIWTLLRSDEPG